MVDNTEKKVNRVLCLSELEFRLLMDTYSISSLSGFKTSITFEKEEEREAACNRAIFSLYKKGYLTISDGEEQFFIKEELGRIFSVISKCKICVVIESSNEMVSSVCMYINEENQVVIMEPGQKESEYAKLRLIDREDMLEYFMEMGILRQQYIAADVARLIEVTPEDMIGGQVVVDFIITNGQTEGKVASVSVVEYSLFDRILVQIDGQTNHYPMDNNSVIDKIFEIKDLLEEKGISR